MQITLNYQSEVVSLIPCFPMYSIYAQTFNSKFVGVPYQDFVENQFQAYIDVINEKTKLVIFTNPEVHLDISLVLKRLKNLQII